MDLGSASREVWALDVEHWGVMAIGANEREAIDRLRDDAMPAFNAFLMRHGGSPRSDPLPRVVERLESAPDEYAFAFDRAPATEVERVRTTQILEWAHHDLTDLLGSASDEQLNYADTTRRLPTWAWWTTARLMAWHVAITESRYYLPRVGLEPLSDVQGPGERPLPTKSELLALLDVSHANVLEAVKTLPLDVVRELHDGEVWTSRKVLRRLARHERDETRVVHHLVHSAQASS